MIALAILIFFWNPELYIQITKWFIIKVVFNGLWTNNPISSNSEKQWLYDLQKQLLLQWEGLFTFSIRIQYF